MLRDGSTCNLGKMNLYVARSQNSFCLDLCAGVLRRAPNLACQWQRQLNVDRTVGACRLDPPYFSSFRLQPRE